MIEPRTQPPDDAVMARVRPRWGASRGEHNLSAAFGRITHRQRLRRAGAIATAAAGVAIAAAAFFIDRPARRQAPSMAARIPSPSTSAPQSSSQSSSQPSLNGATPAPGGAARIITLADGSTVSLLDPRSRAVVAADVRDRIDLRLIDGPAAFEVREAPGRSFVVRLTRIEVKILAASFVLTPDGDRAQLRVTAGRVQVDWPGGTGTVGPGAPVWFPPSLTEATPARKADAPAGVSSLRSRFRAQAARHDYAAAYRSLVSAPGVAQQSAEDLMLAADAARLSGHPAEAVPYLRHLLDDYPADERAPVAAFTLGRILLSQLARPAEAADAFGLSRRLAPGGTLAPDALAREVEASARAGDRVRARALAAEYVSRYPGGRRAEAVRRFAGVE